MNIYLKNMFFIVCILIMQDMIAAELTVYNNTGVPTTHGVILYGDPKGMPVTWKSTLLNQDPSNNRKVRKAWRQLRVNSGRFPFTRISWFDKDFKVNYLENIPSPARLSGGSIVLLPQGSYSINFDERGILKHKIVKQAQTSKEFISRELGESSLPEEEEVVESAME